jgi:hypothetical protein
VDGTHSLALATIRGEVLLRRAVNAAELAGLDVLVVASDDVLPDVIDLMGNSEPVVRSADVSAAVGQVDRLLIHDPLCPLTPPEFLASIATYGDVGITAIGVLAVTDTVKTADRSVVAGTLDRAGLGRIASPLVASGESVTLVSQNPELVLHVPALARRLVAAGRVEFVTAPSTATRVEDESELELLECVDEVRRLASDR